MNIFALDYAPGKAAASLCDKHVNKMAVESFQMMASALIRHGFPREKLPLTQAGTPARGGYPNHPCTRWAGDSYFNFYWLGVHAICICEQFKLRYGKVHGCLEGINKMLKAGTELMPAVDGTPFYQAVPDKYRGRDAVNAYRAYYYHEKKRFATWSKGVDAPDWWPKSDWFLPT